MARIGSRRRWHGNGDVSWGTWAAMPLRMKCVPSGGSLIQDWCRNNNAEDRGRRSSPLRSLRLAPCNGSLYTYMYVFSLFSRRPARYHPESLSVGRANLSAAPGWSGDCRFYPHRKTPIFFFPPAKSFCFVSLLLRQWAKFWWPHLGATDESPTIMTTTR